MSRLEALVLLAGYVATVAGATWWLGPLALVAGGLVAMAASLLIDWEKLEEALHDQPDQAPPRRR